MHNTGIEANTDEWLEARKGYLSASDLGAVLGVNKWKTWDEVKNGGPKEFTEEELARFKAGHAVEVALKGLWADEVPGRTLSATKSTLWTHEALAATPDGFGVGETGARALIEAKFVGYRLLTHWEKGPPLYVRLQVQGQLICTGADYCDVVAAIGGPGYHEWRIKREPELVELILEAAEVYMTQKPDDNVQTKWVRRLHEMGYEQPPEKAWPIGEPGLVANAEVKMADRLNRAWLAREAANEEYEEATTQVKEFMRDAEFLTVGERVVATWKTSARNGYDWKKLEAMVGREALNSARKPSTVRTFLVKPSKPEDDQSNIW